MSMASKAPSKGDGMDKEHIAVSPLIAIELSADDVAKHLDLGQALLSNGSWGAHVP
jgi:hypothetical protein